MSATITAPVNGTLLKQQVLELGRRYAALLPTIVGEGELATRAARVEAMISALELGLFRLVVMGEIKKGKSSFINGLLDHPDLLPIATDVATSTVYKIVYGVVEKFTVYFHSSAESGAAGPEAVEITRQQLLDYGTEAGNPGNGKNVAFIMVELPHESLKEGLTIVDTPGVGGLFKKHRDITFQYAPSADAVLFIVDSVEAPLTNDEIQFLKELRKNTATIAFLQTKTDLASRNQVEAWKNRNLDILQQELDLDVEGTPYFLVSAELKRSADTNMCEEDLQDSGYLGVRDYLRHVLMPKKDEILATRSVNALIADVEVVGHGLADRLVIAQQTNKATLDAYDAQLSAAERQFHEWQNDQWPKRQREFRRETDRVKRQARNSTNDTFSASGFGFKAVLETVEETCGTANDIEAVAARMVNDYTAHCNKEANNILTDFHASYCTVYKTTLDECINDLEAIEIPKIKIDSGDPPKFSGVGRRGPLRQAMMDAMLFGRPAKLGATALATVAGAALVAGTLPVAIPAAALAAALYVSVIIWQGVTGYKMARQGQREAAINTLRSALLPVADRARMSTLRGIEELGATLDGEAQEGFERLQADFKQDFAKRKQEVAATKKRTSVEAAEAVATLTQQIRALADIAEPAHKIAEMLKALT